jgi:hypothetical protein
MQSDKRLTNKISKPPSKERIGCWRLSNPQHPEIEPVLLEHNEDWRSFRLLSTSVLDRVTVKIEILISQSLAIYLGFDVINAPTVRIHVPTGAEALVPEVGPVCVEWVAVVANGQRPNTCPIVFEQQLPALCRVLVWGESLLIGFCISAVEGTYGAGTNNGAQ